MNDPFEKFSKLKVGDMVSYYNTYSFSPKEYLGLVIKTTPEIIHIRFNNCGIGWFDPLDYRFEHLTILVSSDINKETPNEP